MIKKLISISAIAAAALMTVAIPSAQGGKWLSYNTTWTITCFGDVAGNFYLTTRKDSFGPSPAACSTTNPTINTGIINTATAPTNWTLTMPGCFKTKFAPISGKVGQRFLFDCYLIDSNGTIGDLVYGGSVLVDYPAGSTTLP